MAEWHSWMKWGGEGITPNQIDDVVNRTPNDNRLRKWKRDWQLLNQKLQSDEIRPELFSKAVTKAMFPLYYLADSMTSTKNGLYWMSVGNAGQKHIKVTTFQVMKNSLDEMAAYFDKTSYKGFKSAINGSGTRGALSDGPKEQLKSSVPTLDHVRLGAGRSSDRLWFATGNKVLYAISGHIDATSNGKREHDKLVKKVNGAGSTKCTVALSDYDGFEGQLFFIK